jgi:hypothetical protein
MQWRNFTLFTIACALGLALFAACDLQAAQGVPTRIAEALPRPTAEGAAPAPEQPAPEQPAPEQPAPEQPAPEQPAPEQPAPEQPAPQPPAPEPPAPEQQPAEPNPAAAINWLLVWLIVATIVVIYLIGRSIGRNSRPQPPVQAAPTVQTNINVPTTPVAPLAAAAPVQPVAAAEVQRRFVFYPGTDTIPPQDNPPIYDRSHTITVALTRTAVMEEGVLLALGTMQAGYTLYIQGNRLVYLLALGTVVRQIVANSEMPIGPSEVRFEFNRTGPFRGTGALFINGQLVGAQIFEQTMPLPSSEGLDIGIDRGIPVTNSYPAPFPFGGTIQSVVYELTPDSSVDAQSIEHRA